MSRSVSRRAQRVWDRLASWYGTRLVDQYGKHPPEDWCGAIDRTDDERLEVGLLGARRASPAHPPTLGQFEAAIPAKQIGIGGQSAPEKLCEYAIKTFGHELCKHQIARPWSYFGPMTEYASKGRGGQMVMMPEVRGVVVPACDECGKQSRRVLLAEILGDGERAA